MQSPPAQNCANVISKQRSVFIQNAVFLSFRGPQARGNLPVQYLLLRSASVDGARGLPRHPFGVPRNDSIFLLRTLASLFEGGGFAEGEDGRSVARLLVHSPSQKSKIFAGPAGPAPLLSALRTFSPLTGKSTLIEGAKVASVPLCRGDYRSSVPLRNIVEADEQCSPLQVSFVPCLPL